MIQSPPPWASFFAPEDWARFVDVVMHDLAQRRLAATLDAAAACIRLSNGQVLGLNNLAQMCKQVAVVRWPGIVAHHIGVGLAPKDVPVADAMSKDFALARPALKLRLWDRATVPTTPMVGWDIAGDLVALLTFDLPETLVTVKADDARGWGVTKDELWRVALANVRAEAPLPSVALDLDSGAVVHVIEGDASFFAASHALFLEAYAGDTPFGAVIAVPRRHTVVFHVLADQRAVDALTSILRVVPKLWHEGPGSITPSIYWWRPGAPLVDLPWNDDRGTIDLRPPPAFAETLRRLP